MQRNFVHEPLRRRCFNAAKVFAGVGLALLIYESAAVAAEYAAAAEIGGSTAAERLEQVVITARKREESLQQVPVSVTALTANDLTNRSADDLSAVAQSVPNFTFGSFASAGRSAGIVYIRGVGQFDTRATYDPAVGVYLDGVFLGRMQGNDLEMMEVQRVEVLRGPQGTLFGKNTSGGAVNIITKQPDAAGTSGELRATGGSRNRYDVMGTINLPLAADKVAILLSGSRRKQDGYGLRADGQDMGSTNRDAGRFSLLLKPGDNFSALLSADAMTYDETNAVMALVGVNTKAALVTALNARTPAKYDARWLSPSEFFNYATGPNSSRGNLWGTSLTLNLDSRWGTIKSISAYRFMNIHNDLDPDGSPITVIDLFDHTKQHQFSQELQATGQSFADRLSWVAGTYYFREAVSDNSLSYHLFTPLLGGRADYSLTNPVTNDSIATYGQANYNLSNRLKFTAGLRYTHDKKEVGRIRSSFPGGALLEPVLTKSVSSNDWSPRVGFDYHWTPTIMTYASFAKGYKAGGFNGRGSSNRDFNQFNPEIVWTYELGLRSDLLDGHVRFNATAFYSDYSDLQLQINGTTVSNGVPASFAIVTNIPKAQITGGELELTVVPARGLTLTGGLGLTYAKYTELPTDPRFVAANLVNRSSQFVNTPKASISFGAEYAVPVSAAFDVTGRLDYAYKSTIYYGPTNSSLLRQGPYGLLNARVTIEHEPSHLSLAVFGTNLTDKRYITGAFDDSDVPNPGLGLSFVDFAPPRQYGASVQWRF